MGNDIELEDDNEMNYIFFGDSDQDHDSNSEDSEVNGVKEMK